jgi:nuclease-like protein
MIQRATEYEADLVVASPNAGVAIIEVKGGYVSRHEGQWYQSSHRACMSMITRGPAKARRCSHRLRSLRKNMTLVTL